MKKPLIFTLVLSLLLSTSAFSVTTVSATEGCGYVYVATNGSDSAEGTLQAPLATLQAAQQKVRAMKASGSYPNGITVYVRGGAYNLSQPLVLTAEDSGTEAAPITWSNYENETVTFTAGVAVAGSQFQKVTDSAILNRVVEEAARDRLYSLDLSDYGVTDPGAPYLFGAYGYSSTVTDLGLATRPAAPAMEIFYNNVAMTNARYPNEGYMTVDTVVEKGWDFDDPNRVAQGTPFTISVNDNRMSYWTQAPTDTIMMYGFWKWEWADQTIPLHSIDAANKQLTSKWHSVFGVLEGKPFYVTNLLEELDQPGEYYIDRANRMLYINPPSDLSTAEITLSVMEASPFQLQSTSYITMKGLDVKCARNSAYAVTSGNYNKIVDCEISYTAKTAVNVTGSHNGVVDCYIHDVDGGVGIYGGDIATLTYGENYVDNNEIERFTRLTKTYMPAIEMNGVGNRASHNEIHDATHQAIAYGGQCQEISYNDIYDVLQTTDDAGAIYGGLSWDSRGHEIKYNYIHDCQTEGTGRDGVWAIYGDGGQCELYIYGNIVANFSGVGVILNGGWDNVVKNNYFINTKQGVDVGANMSAEIFKKHHYPRLEPYKNTIMNSAAWKERFPSFFAMMAVPDDVKAIPQGNVVADNLYYKQGYAPITTRTYVNAAIEPLLQLNEDPGFVNETEGNYSLKADSPLLELADFEALPFEQMGRLAR